MLMAAGLGTRMRPFTELHPKALLPLMGIPMAQFAADALASAGVRRIVANVHHHADKARDALARLDWAGMELIISDESELLLGSSGGLRKALPDLSPGLSEPFFLVNADVVCSVDLGALASEHKRLRRAHGVALTLTVFPAGPSPGKYREILFDPGTRLVTGLTEPVEGRPYFVGAAVFEPEALEDVPQQGASEFIPSVLLPGIRKKKVGVYLANGYWFDIGDPRLWRDAHIKLMSGLETGQIPPQWRRRIERENKRVAERIWVSKRSPRAMSQEWCAPAYFDSMESGSRPPRYLGPGAVLYGAPKSRDHDGFVDGAGYRGLWVPTG